MAARSAGRAAADPTVASACTAPTTSSRVALRAAVTAAGDSSGNEWLSTSR